MSDPQILTPDRGAIADLREAGMLVADPAEARKASDELAGQILAMQRRLSGPWCAMTGRDEAPWRLPVAVHYLSRQEGPVRVSVRFCCTMARLEAYAWGKWLYQAMTAGVRHPDGTIEPVPLAEVAKQLPPPGPHTFSRCPVWPGIGHGGPMRKRRPRARRS